MSRDDLENLLRNHLSSELDPQRGRAARAFEAQVINPMKNGLSSRSRQWHAARSWSILATAMAACIIVGYSVPHYFSNQPPTIDVASLSNSTAPIEARTVGFQQTKIQSSFDAGSVILDNNMPGRKIVLQEIKNYNWYDPNTGGHFEITEPRQHNLFLPVHQQ